MDSKISNRTFYFACKRFFGCGCYPILKDTQGSKIDKVAEFGDNFNTNSNVYMRLTKFEDKRMHHRIPQGNILPRFHLQIKYTQMNLNIYPDAHEIFHDFQKSTFCNYWEILFYNSIQHDVV